MMCESRPAYNAIDQDVIMIREERKETAVTGPGANSAAAGSKWAEMFHR